MPHLHSTLFVRIIELLLTIIRAVPSRGANQSDLHINFGSMAAQNIGERLLTFEEFATLLKRIEAELNSQPLTAMTDDPNDMEAITPAHFLCGEAIIRPLGPSVREIPWNRPKAWGLLHRMEQQFAGR